VADFPNHHRPLTPQLNLYAILSHVEERVIGNDYTLSFAGHRYQIQRVDVQTGMRRQRLRMELRLDGELKAYYQGRYLAIEECGARVQVIQSKASQPVRKDHNAGGRSKWMDGFFGSCPKSVIGGKRLRSNELRLGGFFGSGWERSAVVSVCAWSRFWIFKAWGLSIR
jgi:hypothetical protein